jgi:hypothetical protein
LRPMAFAWQELVMERSFQRSARAIHIMAGWKRPLL